MDTFYAVFLLVVNQYVCTSMRHPCKTRVLATITKFRVIISINLITTLGSVACYILLPACKVEMQVKRQLFWQVSDDVRIWVTPT